MRSEAYSPIAQTELRVLSRRGLGMMGKGKGEQSLILPYESETSHKMMAALQESSPMEPPVPWIHAHRVGAARGVGVLPLDRSWAHGSTGEGHIPVSSSQ